MKINKVIPWINLRLSPTPTPLSAPNLKNTFLRLVALMAILSCASCLGPNQAGGTTLTAPGSQQVTSTANPQGGPTAAGSGVAQANLSDVNAIARQVYDQAQAGQDLTPLLGGIFQGLSIPVLAEASSLNQGMATIKAGKAAVFDVQLEMIAQGFKNGMATKLDSLVADLSTHKVEDASTSGPLTTATLTQAMTGLVGKTSLKPEETLPGLVIALGQERARRLNLASADPVWGDGYLDPLQYALLTYGIFVPGIHSMAGLKLSNPTVHSGAIALVKNGLEQGSAGFFDKYLKNLDPLNFADYVICGLYVINNTQFIIQGPQSVYHKQTDETSPPPYQAEVKVTLFMTAPGPTQRDLLLAAGCKIPPNSGPVPDKTISWTLDSAAQSHGSLTQTNSKTKADGSASATYETIVETTPKAGRIPPALQKVTGNIQAEVLDLIDGHPQLSATDRLAGNLQAGRNALPLEIRFYANLALEIAGTYQIPGRDVSVTNVVISDVIPLTDNNGVLQGSGKVTVSSSAQFNCGSGGIVQAKGTFSGKITVVAAPTLDGSQLGFSFIPDLSILKPPAANIMCVAGDLNDVAWAGIVAVLQAKFTLGGNNLTYSFTPPAATGTLKYTLQVLTK
jgi:hypothetical protein